ncbi:DUF1806 family protein [Paenibacillus solisilvae]|uniref:DUF1806 family protein n=1 Tax=Paenibacillus solisilvae TaxID=2486751 RepID=A0ABW0VSF3_9BACL
MKIIHKANVDAAFQSFLGQAVYMHAEATSSVFVRNFRVSLQEAVIAGEGSFRIGLRFDGHGWLRMEGLTHYEWDNQERLILAGFDDLGRMNVTLELGREPFPE